MNSQTPLVSIICPTYNHEKYIAQALEGFLMQKTTFQFEIIVHDDASTDRTATIVKEYESRFPELFNNIYQTENQLSKGIARVTLITFSAARGKYIALCEGDDFWSDPNKLQVQLDFLEANMDYALSFHRVYVISEEMEKELSSLNTSTRQETYGIEELAKNNFIHTPSVIFRNGLFKELPAWFLESPVGDYPLHMLNARHGKIKYFPEPMAVYRRHSGGMWSMQDAKVIYVKWIKVIELLIGENFNEETIANLRAQKTRVINSYLQILFNTDYDLFLREFESYAEDKDEMIKEFFYNYFPKKVLENNIRIREAESTLFMIKRSISHRIVSRLNKQKPIILSRRLLKKISSFFPF